MKRTHRSRAINCHSEGDAPGDTYIRNPASAVWHICAGERRALCGARISVNATAAPRCNKGRICLACRNARRYGTRGE